MANKLQMTGMRGVYLVGAELSRLGFVVSPTSRSAMGADLLVTDQRCRKAWSVQVKTNVSTHDFWLIGDHAKDTVSDSHVYVLVNIFDKGAKAGQVDYFVISSKELARFGVHDTKWPHIKRNKIAEYKDRWQQVFGNPK